MRPCRKTKKYATDIHEGTSYSNVKKPLQNIYSVSMYLLLQKQKSYIHTCTCMYIRVGGKYRQNTVHSEMFSRFLKNGFSLGGVNFFFSTLLHIFSSQTFFWGRPKGAYRQERQSFTVML
jgi:hypothetical protein